MPDKDVRDKTVGVRVNKTEFAYFVNEAKGYRLSTPELLRVSGLLLSELLKTHNVADDLLGHILKAIAIDDIAAADVLAVLCEPDGDVEHQLTELLHTGSLLQTAS